MFIQKNHLNRVCGDLSVSECLSLSHSAAPSRGGWNAHRQQDKCVPFGWVVWKGVRLNRLGKLLLRFDDVWGCVFCVKKSLEKGFYMEFFFILQNPFSILFRSGTIILNPVLMELHPLPQACRYLAETFPFPLGSGERRANPRETLPRWQNQLKDKFSCSGSVSGKLKHTQKCFPPVFPSLCMCVRVCVRTLSSQAQVSGRCDLYLAFFSLPVQNG